MVKCIVMKASIIIMKKIIIMKDIVTGKMNVVVAKTAAAKAENAIVQVVPVNAAANRTK